MLSTVSEQIGSLSNAERKVGECLLAEPKWFVHAAVSEIAARAQVSQPTVIRFCRSLKYDGLTEFKLALSASLSQAGLPYVHEQLNTDDSMGEVREKVLGNAAAALLGARQSLNEASLEKAVSLLCAARRIEFYGLGDSGLVAQDAQHKFFRFGLSAVAYSDPHIQLMAAAVLSSDDVLAVISNSGSSIELLDAVAVARENGARIIALTRTGSPLSKLADCVLAVQPAEDSLLYTPMVSRLLQLAVVDILAVGLALRLGETASLTLAKGKQSVGRHRVAENADD